MISLPSIISLINLALFEITARCFSVLDIKCSFLLSYHPNLTPTKCLTISSTLLKILRSPFSSIVVKFSVSRDVNLKIFLTLSLAIKSLRIDLLNFNMYSIFSDELS